MSTSTYEAAIAFRRPRRSWLWFVGGGVVGVATAWLLSQPLLWPVAFLLLGAVAIVATAVRQLLFQPRPGRARVDAESLTLLTKAGAAVAVIPRKEIAEGWFVPMGVGGRVVLRASRRVEIETWTEQEARDLLAALGLDAKARRMSFQAPGGIAQLVGAGHLRFGGILGAVIVTVATAFAGASLLALVPFVLALLLGIVPGRIEIAADGLFADWQGRSRFISFADVRRVSGRRLVLASGEKVTLPPLSSPVMLDRIQSAFDAHRADEAQHATAALARGDRDAASWLAHLRALRDGGYREQALTDDQLWAVVEHASAPEDARAAAATVLRRSLDDAGRGRMRVAGEAVASPKLRVALEAAAEPASDDDAIEKGLAAFEGES